MKNEPLVLMQQHHQSAGREEWGWNTLWGGEGREGGNTGNFHALEYNHINSHSKNGLIQI